MQRFAMQLNFEQRGVLYAALNRDPRFARADGAATMLAMVLLFLPACLLALTLSTRPPTPREIIGAACIMGILGGLFWSRLQQTAGIARDALRSMGFDETAYRTPAARLLDSPVDRLSPPEIIQMCDMLRTHPYYRRLSRHIRIASATVAALLLFFACVMIAHGRLPLWAQWLQFSLLAPPAAWIAVCQSRENQMEVEAAERLSSIEPVASTAVVGT